MLIFSKMIGNTSNKIRDGIKTVVAVEINSSAVTK